MPDIKNHIAVFTKGFGPTTTKGDRIQTTCFGRSHDKPWVRKFTSWDWGRSQLENHEVAARAAFYAEWPEKAGGIVATAETPDGHVFFFPFDDRQEV